MNTAHDKGKHTTQHSRHVHQLKIGPRQSTIHRNLKTFKYHFHIFSLMHSNRPPEYTHGSLNLWFSPSPTGEYSTRSQTVSSTSSTSIGRRIDIQLGQYTQDILHSTAWDSYTLIPLREYYITNRDLPTHRTHCSYNLANFWCRDLLINTWSRDLYHNNIKCFDKTGRLSWMAETRFFLMF